MYSLFKLVALLDEGGVGVLLEVIIEIEKIQGKQEER